MSYLLKDIIEFIASNDLCEGAAIDAFWDKLPDLPDDCLALFEYASDVERPWDKDTMHRSVQIIFRAPTASKAKAKATQVYNLINDSLDEAGRIDYNGRFSQTTLRQTPFKIDEDAKARVFYGFNMGITTSIDT